MKKQYFLLHLAIALTLTTQVNAQSIQNPTIIYNPDYFQLSPDGTVTPDRTTTVDNTDTTAQNNPDDSISTTDDTPVGVVDTTDTEEPTYTAEPETPAVIGPGVERPVYTIDKTTPETPTTVTPTRPPRTFTPTRPTDPIPEIPETPVVENCPLFNPLDQNPVKCPTSAPVIPVFPLMMVLGPLGGLLLFFFVFKLLQNSHLKTEAGLEQKRQNNLNSQRSSAQKQQSYHDYLDFVSNSLTQAEFSQSDLLKQQAQLELFGSEPMLKLHQQIQSAFQENDHQKIKAVLPALITQIRLEE